ncbi:MAG: hypothetical protein VB070_13725 [Clostridiaceae bacterium]|nr:hypothetical protein [Clostridiaceae bacterium]
MFKTKIGFAPSTWESWDGSPFTGKWAGKMRARCLEVLNRIPGIEVVVPSENLTEYGCIGTPEEGKKARDLFLKENVQGIIIGNMNFGHETSIGTMLTGIRKDMPILHFATLSGPYSPQGNRATDTWCGQFMTCSAIKRRGFKFEHIRTCNPENPEFFRQTEAFVRACTALAKFRNARVVQIGTRPTGFESQFFSEEDMMRNFDQMLIPVDLDTAFSYIDAIPSDSQEVLRIVEEIKSYTDYITEELSDSLINQARFELALKNIVAEYNASAIAVSCWTRLQARYHIAGCSTFSRLNNQGIITACEVDVMGALTMLAMNACGMGMTPPDFIDWTDLHPTAPNVWLAWHCGNAAASLCAPDCKKQLTVNERLALWGPACHGAIEFRMKNGPVTCGRLVEYEGKYSFFFGKGEVINMPPMTRGSYAWVKVNDIGDWEDKMIETGVVHHGVLIYDEKVADALMLFCKFLNIQAAIGK